MLSFVNILLFICMLDIYVNKVFVIIPKLLCIFFDQDFKVSARACVLDLGFENAPSACIASMDSIMD
jgi:hypothetical protein